MPLQRSIEKGIKAKSAFPLINSVLRSLQDGFIFEDELRELTFIIHKAGFSYFMKNHFNNHLELFDFLLTSQNIPRYFHIYNSPKQIISLCEENDHLVNIKLRKRAQLKYTSGIHLQNDALLPLGFNIREMDTQNLDSLSVFDLDLTTRFWKSKNDLIDNGFGFFISNGNDPVSICYSACVADNVAEIDVMTLPGFQKMGLAKIAVEKFVQYCVARDIVANWDCFEDNLASIKTARSLGFNLVKEYTLLSIFNKSKSI